MHSWPFNRWRGDAGSSLLDGARTDASSPRNDLVKNYRVHPTHWLTSTQVLSGAISTILASIPMLFTQIIFFYKFGVFILLTIVLSLIFSLFFFASVLAEIGPIGKRGQVSLLYRDCVNRAKEELDEMDEAQRLVDEQSVRKEGSVKRSWSRASVDDAAEEPPAAPVDL